jgi:ribose transport system substrate-binding protein
MLRDLHVCGHQGTEPACPVRFGSCVYVPALSVFLLLFLQACHRDPPTIALVPRTTGMVLWEATHAGVAQIARREGFSLYYNAPTREDEVSSQIKIINDALRKGIAGLIVCPIEALPLRTTVRNAIAEGIPTVVVGTDLGIPTNPKLGYVLSNEELGGALAARRIGFILHSKGQIAIVGINYQLTSTAARERSFEAVLAREFPQIRVAIRRLGFPTVPQEQQSAEELVNQAEHVDAIVALSHISTRGAYYALAEFNKTGTTKLLGFDQELLSPLTTGGIDSIVFQDTYGMGQEAMRSILGQIRGERISSRVILDPVLVTRENLDSARVRRLATLAWWSDQ